mmetsp:Transcript_21582/g.40307  ORF Transcript_21582/g.40307 Transcript_21582/m.40307 type:complete len:540 (-) Transcript_21582:361-1980(-)
MGVRDFAAQHRKFTSGNRRSWLYRLVICSTVLAVVAGLWSVHMAMFQLRHRDHSQTGSVQQLRVSEAPMKSALKQEEAKTDVKTPTLFLYATEGCPESALVKKIELDEVTGGSSGLYSLCKMEKFKSMRLIGKAEIDFFSSCNVENHYVGSLFASEGCVKRYNYPVAQSFKFNTALPLSRKQISPQELITQWESQDHKPVLPASGIPKTRIIFSCESSEYFGYQVWANYYGYLTSGQKSASWTRLLTAGERDDLSDAIPGLATFQAKRSLYSRRYSPINKPDIIAKWYESADRPKEEIVAVIDPDNWLLRDLSQYTSQVTPGNAIGEPAYYHGSRSAQRMWKEVCRNNCDVSLDLVGVPYIVHREDLAKIAPLWRSYTIMLKDRMDSDKDFSEKYKSLDLSWAAEMFGYNMASAHVGVVHKVVPRIQIRDVDSERRKSKLQDISMIHVGRAWFPKSDPSAYRWAHTEGKSFARNGQQVWCKCNYTGSVIQPWPVPEDADFQSTKTLEILHYSNERFGPVPENKKFRFGATQHGYGASLD